MILRLYWKQPNKYYGLNATCVHYKIVLCFQVNPVFRSAYDALRALNVYDVEEIRSYRTPPRQVVLVVNAVCLLFGKEET
jgi:hypothetical protein